MRRDIQLYIISDTGVYERIEQFDEQNITIKSSLKDIKDIGKLYSDRSRQFRVPASKKNNKLFKHYENPRIQNGYDGRIKRDAVLQINGYDYRLGRVSIKGVDKRHGEAFAYRVVFFGRIISLKDLIGEDMIHDLARDADSYLADFTKLYDNTYVRDGFTDGWNLSGSTLVKNTDDTAGDICFPFISAESHYYYDEAATADPNIYSGVQSREVNSNTSSSNHGIDTRDLKPAIRIHHIVKAIEERYGVTFSTDFFDTTSDRYHQLYLWCHRQKGKIGNQLQIDSYQINIDDLQNTITPDLRSYNDNNVANRALVLNCVNPSTFKTYYRYDINFKFTPTVGTGLYSVKVINNWTKTDAPCNKPNINVDGSDGAQTFSFGITAGSATLPQNQNNTSCMDTSPVIVVETQGGISSFKIEDITIRGYRWADNSTTEYDIPHYTFNSGSAVSLSSGLKLLDNLPKMKVIDFLTSLFKAFNLVAETVDDQGNVNVMTLSDYYASGRFVDLTRYIDNESSKVDKANLYSQISFKFEKPNTFAIENDNEITGTDFGDAFMNNRSAEIASPLAFDGGKYDLKLKFGKMMYERMRDQSDVDNLSDIQWGWAVSKEQRPVMTKPLLMYCVKETPTSGTQTMYLNYNNSDSFQGVGFGQTYTDYIRPSNTLEQSGYTINFDSERDEFYGIDNVRSLFQTYYYDFIVPLYDKRARLFTLEGWLPVEEIIKLTLADTIGIRQSEYHINSMELNLSTGTVKFELINLFEIGNIIEEYSPDPPSEPPSDTTDPVIGTLSYVASSATNNSIDVSITGSTDNVGISQYDIYVDSAYYTTKLAQTQPYEMTVDNLDAGTSYNIQVLARDAAGNTSSLSNTVTQSTTNDTTAPVAGAITLVSKSQTTVTIEMSATDDVGVTVFRVYKDGVFLQNKTSGGGTSETEQSFISSLLPNTEYTFKFRARDAQANESGDSADLVVTTDSF